MFARSNSKMDFSEGKIMYSFDSRVRFSEVDETHELRVTSLINFFQDCSTFQSESIGLGIDALKGYGKAWVLSSWQICVNRYPMMREDVRVETWPTGFEGMYGTRNFRLCTKAGEVLAYANSIWIFMDMRKGRPIRAMEEDVKAYPVEPAMDMEYAPRKILLPKELEEKGSYPVLRSQIDTNSHMNNSQYVQVALEIYPEGKAAKQIRVEYKKSAVYGDVIYAKIAKEEERTVVVLADEQDKVYAAVEFK